MSIPKTAPVGWYSFNLSADYTDTFSWEPMRVYVNDFTPSPFRVTNELNGDLFRVGNYITVKTAAKLHSGGPHRDANARVTATFVANRLASTFLVTKGFTFIDKLEGGEKSSLSDYRYDRCKRRAYNQIPA